jgi:hypothetical protein
LTRVPLVHWRSSGDSEHGHRTAGPRNAAVEGKDPNEEDDGFRAQMAVARDIRARVEALPVSFPQFKTFVVSE